MQILEDIWTNNEVVITGCNNFQEVNNVFPSELPKISKLNSPNPFTVFKFTPYCKFHYAKIEDPNSTQKQICKMGRSRATLYRTMIGLSISSHIDLINGNLKP